MLFPPGSLILLQMRSSFPPSFTSAFYGGLLKLLWMWISALTSPLSDLYNVKAALSHFCSLGVRKKGKYSLWMRGSMFVRVDVSEQTFNFPVSGSIKLMLLNVAECCLSWAGRSSELHLRGGASWTYCMGIVMETPRTERVPGLTLLRWPHESLSVCFVCLFVATDTDRFLLCSLL